MGYVLEVHIVDAGDQTIKVTHQFWGESEAECENYYREHLASCEYFRSAKADGRVLEEMAEIDDEELPDPADFEEEEDVIR